MATLLSQFQKNVADYSPRASTPGGRIKYTRYVKLRTKQSCSEPSKKQQGKLRSLCSRLCAPCRRKNKTQQQPEGESSDEDCDGETLEKHMMKVLEKEKHTLRNWKAVILRVQMVNAFNLSQKKNELQIQEQTQKTTKKKEKGWWENGTIIIYPEQKIGLCWGFFKTVCITISLFTFTFSAAFMFSDVKQMRDLELFFDFVQLVDIILTCFTARRSNDISESTRQQLKKQNGDDMSNPAIKYTPEWECNIKIISLEYLKTDCIQDILACVPLILTFESIVVLYPFKILRVTKIKKVIRFL